MKRDWKWGKWIRNVILKGGNVREVESQRREKGAKRR